MEILILLLVGVHLVLGGTHSLYYIYTAVTPGINFPEYTAVGLVDSEQFLYYDSNISRSIPKTEWIKKIAAEDPNYWDSETQISKVEQETFKSNVNIVMKRFNHTEGVHTVQEMYGCELDDDGTTRRFRQFGYDGEDLISLDLKTFTYTAAKPQAVITKNNWESDPLYTHYWRKYLEYKCIDWLKKYVSYGREILERKVRPEVSLFQNYSSSSEVVCHATGFFPKALNISWQKDGEHMLEDVELNETLPNQDGSFQKRSVLKVSAEELQKHKYTCVIQHSSLEEGLVLPVSERRILRGGGLMGIIVGVVVGLVALIVVIAGIVVWKKKSSGYKQTASNADSAANRSDVEMEMTVFDRD